jgi:3-carboxy-cis,cis-muconate cycloisomerase
MHPFLSDLLGDEEVSACFSAQAEIAAMLLFEKALAQAEAEEGVIPADAAEAIAASLAEPRIDMDGLRGRNRA